MNNRTSSMLKGMLVTPLVVTLVCVLIYQLSLLYPQSFPRTFALRLLFILPPLSALIGGFLGWHCSQLSKKEKTRLFGAFICVVAWSLSVNLAWNWLFGPPRDQETKILQQLFISITSGIVGGVWLGFSIRRQG